MLGRKNVRQGIRSEILGDGCCFSCEMEKEDPTGKIAGDLLARVRGHLEVKIR